jgi:hypothetical protein
LFELRATRGLLVIGCQLIGGSDGHLHPLMLLAFHENINSEDFVPSVCSASGASAPSLTVAPVEYPNSTVNSQPNRDSGGGRGILMGFHS